MQTNFSPEQLTNARLAEADAILRRCVHCGLCTATCPTYVLLGDERDSPRGRIYLIKDMLEDNAPASPEVQLHLDRCLSCLSCMSTCPSGVDYMHLIDLARGYVEQTAGRPFKERFVRRLLAFVLPYPERFRLALRLAPLGRPWLKLLRRLQLNQLAAMIELAPAVLPPAPKYEGAGVAATEDERRARVIMLSGCAQQVLRPGINDSTIRLLARRGVDVVVAHGAGCCGALTYHLGNEAGAIEFAKRNVDAWSRELAKGPVDAIIANASGCGTTVKDYGHLFAGDGARAERAETIGMRALDVTELVGQLGLKEPARRIPLAVAYHDACSLQHGQKLTAAPRRVLGQAGFVVRDVPEGHFCCGSAGAYNLLQPEIAAALGQRKAGHIEATGAGAVIAGNIGCIVQLRRHTALPVVHTAELIDWATGGPLPPALECRTLTRVTVAADAPAPAAAIW
jgi:glycolate oxidase iron-sulfur subunit